MTFKPNREFSGAAGEKSVDSMGPETLCRDLDKINRMFDPSATHKDGQQGGIGKGNLNFSFGADGTDGKESMAETIGSKEISELKDPSDPTKQALTVWKQIKAIVLLIVAHFDNTSNPHSVTKTQVGLGNADNTSDANKPVSTATQAALNGKVNNSGDETIAGVKTFFSSPIVPAPTTDMQAANKKYVSDNFATKARVDQIITTPISGAAATQEVVDSRGSFTTIGNRLDASDELISNIKFKIQVLDEDPPSPAEGEIWLIRVTNQSPVISGLVVQNASTTGFSIQGLVADAESDSIISVEIQRQTAGGNWSAAVSTILTQVGDINAFIGTEDWYALTATLTAGDYDYRARAKDSGSNMFGNWAASLKSSGGQYKLTENGSVKVESNPVSAPVASPTNNSAQTPTTIVRNGQEMQGYIRNGKTYDTQGNRVQAGDVVTTGGKKFLMTPTGGVDITKAYEAPIYREEGDKDGNATLNNQNKTAYIVNGVSYDSSGNRLAVGDVVQAANGKYYKMGENGGTEYTPPKGWGSTALDTLANELFPEDSALRDIAAAVLNDVNQTMAANPTLSFDEAFAHAAQKLNPQYNQAMDQTMAALDQKALKSGFYGQLPTEALKRQTAGSLETQKLSAIYDLANQLFGQSEDSAYKALNVAETEQQNKINTLLNLLGLYQTERSYSDSKSSEEKNQKLAEAGLTGYYNGQPTLDYLKTMNSISKSKSGSGSGSGGGTMTKEEAYQQELNDVFGGTVAPYTIEANQAALEGQYGKSKYNDLLNYAKKYYKGNGSASDFRLLAGESK